VPDRAELNFGRTLSRENADSLGGKRSSGLGKWLEELRIITKKNLIWDVQHEF